MSAPVKNKGGRPFKLNARQRAEVRSKWKLGVPMTKLAAAYSVSTPAIRRVIHEKLPPEEVECLFQPVAAR